MKIFLTNFMVAVSLVSVMNTQVNLNTIVPSNVELVGKANGLVYLPDDDLFLYYPNMFPGDSVKRTLEIKNQYDYPYELKLKLQRISPPEKYDLLEKLELVITYKDNVIYKGKTSGEEEISLGVFNPGQNEELTAIVTLDGNSTGNEYKNKYAEVKWIFTAVRMEDTPDNESPNNPDINSPKTGDESIIISVILFVVSSILILVIKKTNKKNNKKG